MTAAVPTLLARTIRVVALAVLAIFVPPSLAQQEVTLGVKPSRTSVTPGDQIAIAVVFDHQDEWHIHTNQPRPPEGVDASSLIATEIVPGAAAHATFGPVQWPAAHAVPVDIFGKGKPTPYEVFSGRAIAFLPVFIAADATPGQEITIPLSISYQACNATMCLMPMDESPTITLKVVALGSPAPASSDADFASFDPRAFARGPSSTAPATELKAPGKTAAAAIPANGASFFGFSPAGLRGPLGFVVLALLGVVGGLILNLTPCVLPVIPIKVLTLTQHAGSPRRSMVLAAWMSFGVIAFWLGLGIPAAFVSAWADPSRIFGIWWVTTAIGIVIAAMGVGIMGLFTINLPQGVYMINPKADTAGGSFMFGVMTGVLGLPCFGFVAGALLPAAAAIGAFSTITVFAAMGVGMALPYAILAARPSWLERVPRTGPASELVKQVMGLLMLAAAAYFIGSGLIALVRDMPWIGPKLHWCAIALLGATAGLWLVVRTFQITKKPARRAFFAMLGLVFALGAIWPAWSLTASAREEHEIRTHAMDAARSGAPVAGVWNPYSSELVKTSLAAGKTVVMDFTAEWCLNCKTLKAAVLDREPVRGALKSSDVVMVEVDLTSTSSPGWETLRALGQRGIPLLTVQGPGLSDPWMSGAYTAEQVVAAIAAARAPSAQAALP